MRIINQFKCTDKKKPIFIASAVAALLLICFVLITFAVSALPSGMVKLDVTKNKMYTLGSVSKQIASDVDADVTIYLITSESSQNESIRTVLERFTLLNRRITVRLADPESDATLLSKYISGTPESNSVLVVSGDRFRYIPYSSMFYYSAESYENSFVLYYNYIQGGYLDSSYSFESFMKEFAPAVGLYDGFRYELQISSALMYVTSPSLKTVYMMLGHNEEGISWDVSERLELDLLELRPLMLETSAIPEDADCIFLMPSADITEREYESLSAYLSSGGRLLLITSYVRSASFENLLRLTEEFGLTTDFDRYLCEDNENYNFSGYPGLVVPDVSDIALADILDKNDASVLFGGASGIIKTDEAPDDVSVTPVLTSSPLAYLKDMSDGSLVFNEETDTRGTYYSGVKAENSYGGQLIWFSSGAVIYDDYDVYSARGNKLMFMYALNILSGNQGAPDIPPVMSTNASITAGNTYMYTFLAVFILLSLAVLSFGIIRYRKSLV